MAIDWTNVIVTGISVLLTSGGLVTLVTLRDKKTAAFLDNVNTLVELAREAATERAERAKELKEDLKIKDDKIDELYGVINGQRETLDDLRTALAVATLLKCNKTSCNDRMPPYGSEYVVKEVKGEKNG